MNIILANEYKNRAHSEVFTGMCSSAFLPSLSRVHCYAGIYQKVLQFYGFYQVGVPVQRNQDVSLFDRPIKKTRTLTSSTTTNHIKLRSFNLTSSKLSHALSIS